MLRRLAKFLHTNREGLAAWIAEGEEPEAPEDVELGYEPFDPEIIAEVFGFDEDARKFACEDIDIFGSGYGWEMKELLETIGFELEYYGTPKEEAGQYFIAPEEE